MAKIVGYTFVLRTSTELNFIHHAAAGFRRVWMQRRNRDHRRHDFRTSKLTTRI